jgi:predicted permease
MGLTGFHFPRLTGMGWKCVFETLWQDARYGARVLRLNPGFTLVAALSLALGIGANTAIFELVNSVRLRTLPVTNPEELVKVQIAERKLASGSFNGAYSALTNPQWEAIRDRQRVLAKVAAWNVDTFNLATGGEERKAHGMWVSGEFFGTLGVPAVIGRTFTATDDRRGCAAPGVVISYAFWQREFGGSPAVLAKKITVEGHPFEILGVTPASFYGIEVGRSYDVAIPLCADPMVRGEDARLDVRRSWWLSTIGRLKPGVSLKQAAAQLDSISAGLFHDTLPQPYNPENVRAYLGYRLTALPASTGFSSLRRQYESPLWILLAIAGAVLLIACANLANLMLARASAREREIAVRLAMGASRGRLIRQMLSESLLLATGGALLGALLAQWLSQALVSLLSTTSTAMYFNLDPDWRVLGFTAALAVATCALFGLAPALRATRAEPGTVMKATGRGVTAGRDRFGLRRALVIAQVALSLVLMAGALLFVRSLRNLLTLDAGFQQEGVLITTLDFRAVRVPKERRVAYKTELRERVRAIPGVEFAASVSYLPLNGSSWNQSAVLEKDGKWQSVGDVLLNRISPGYFRTMGAPLLAGRDFDAHDNLSSGRVAIVNESFARKYLPGGSPIGKQFRLEEMPGHANSSFEIVGLARNMKYTDLRDEFSPGAFFPEAQEDDPDLSDQLAIRSNLVFTALLPAVKKAIAEASPDISIGFLPFRTSIVNGLVRERLMATLSGFFGILAALLATIGLYGVISYMVARRRNEIGIRLALGADRGTVIAMVLREGVVLVAIGIAAGAGLALGVAATAESLVFGLKPRDPFTLVTAAVALALVGMFASYVPARRAAGLDPLIALREE